MEYPTITLNSGYKMPLLGLGTFLTAPQDTYNTVKAAIKEGYRMIDTAEGYYNETEVGQAVNDCIKEGIIKREDIFITTKLWSCYNTYEDAIKACEMSIKKLNVGYIDLYLMHQPYMYDYKNVSEELRKSDDFYDCGIMFPHGFECKGYNKKSVADKWAAMEECVKRGWCRSIGISNFTSKKIEELLKTAKIIPAIHQLEYNIPNQETTVSNYCLSKGIYLTAYTQFGRPISDNSGKMIPLKDHTIANIGKKYNKSNAQVIIRWLIQKQIVAIPKSVTLSRLHENFNVLDFTLSNEDMNILNNMNRNDRVFDGSFFATPGQDLKEVWDYEDIENLEN